MVPTIIRSCYYFASAEQVLSPEFTDFLNQFALVVVDKYQFIDSQKRLGAIADTKFIVRRILSRDILTQQTRADKRKFEISSQDSQDLVK